MLSPFPRSNSTLSVSGPAGGLEKTPSDQIFLMNHSVYRPVAPESQCLIGFSIYTSNPPILPATSRRRNSVILCYLLPFPSTGISLSKKSIRGYIKKKEQVRLYIPPLLFAIKKQTNSIHMPEFVQGKAPEYVKMKVTPRLFTGN